MINQIQYNFDEVIDRRNTHAEKYDALKRFYGTDDVEPFWVADMDLASPNFLVDKLIDRVKHSIFGYTEKSPELFESIEWWMKNEHNLDINKSTIGLSPSVVSTLCMTIQSFSNVGDSIVTFSPVYGPFFSSVKSHKRNLIDLPLMINNGKFQVPFDRLESILKKNDVKLLLLCNPHNPGGRVWSKDELLKIVRLCKDNNVIIFSDEIHSDIVYKPNIHTPILALNEAKNISILAHSIGKTFNTSGLKSSFFIVENEIIKNKLIHFQKLSHVDNINLIGKTAIQVLLSPEGANYKRQLVDYLRLNTSLAYKKLLINNKLKPMESDATFLVWCDFRNYGSWQEVSKILINDAKVALSGGKFFGSSGEGWFRINCGHPRLKLLSAVDRICKTFKF